MLALMLDPKFKDLSILSNYVKKLTTATIRYDFETLLPLLYLTNQTIHLFAKHPSNSSPQE
jgi:hypothetical protein